MNEAPARSRGRPRMLRTGQKATLYLDAATLARARAIGQGNVSAGIRAAVFAYQSPASGSGGGGSTKP